MAVKLLTCPFYVQCVNELKGTKDGAKILKELGAFIQAKSENPNQPYRSSDKANPAGTPLATAIPKIKHAHLTHDVSVFYTMMGSNPNELRLYAVLSHDDSGSGQPPNPKKQKSLGAKMSNQTFS
jgi:hypothetical protein